VRGVTARRGFTLLEVMVGLALLGFGLTVLIKSAAGSIFGAQQAHMMGVATDLARAKMYDIEEILIKDGFSDTNQSKDGQRFADEGWPNIEYAYKVEEIELPSWDALQALAQQHGKSAGSGSGSGAGSGAGSGEGGFENSALGGMLAQFGGGFGGGGAGKGSADINSAQGSSFVQGYYQMFQQILKVSIRKVSLTVKWPVLGTTQEMTTVAFYTDAAAMDKVLNGLGAQEQGSGSGSGSGKGSGSGSGSGSGKGSGTPGGKGG
jgi:general secretion pathway protein I